MDQAPKKCFLVFYINTKNYKLLWNIWIYGRHNKINEQDDTKQFDVYEGHKK
jgi:hypothetical protein